MALVCEPTAIVDLLTIGPCELTMTVAQITLEAPFVDCFVRQSQVPSPVHAPIFPLALVLATLRRCESPLALKDIIYEFSRVHTFV